MMRNAMDRTPDQVHAQLTWELACERLNFVVNPPAGATPEGALTDLAAATAQVRHALKELEAAFAPDQND